MDVLVKTYFVGVDPAPLLSALDLAKSEPISPLEISLEERITEYKRLCARVDVFWKDRDRRRATGPASVPVRSQDAKHAVLLRSEGHCESPECTGEIHDVDEAGKPLLEVDHIHDIALGGADDPAQMIALCPNCHTTKTYGQSRERLRAILLETAEARHRRLS